MAFTQEFLASALIREPLERGVRLSIERGFLGRDLAEQIVTGPVNDRGFIARAQRIPGFSFALVAGAVAEFLKLNIERMVPSHLRDDAGVKEAIVILKAAIPALIVGASEGITDSDAWRAKVRAIFDRVRTVNPAVPVASRTAEVDIVVVRGDEIYVPQRDAASVIMRDGANRPICDVRWRKVLEAWDASNEPAKIKWQEMPLENAVKIIDLKLMSQESLEVVEKLLREKTQGWSDKIGEEGRTLMFALSKTKRWLPYLTQAIGEDLFKDLAGHASPNDFKDLAQRLVPRLQQDGTLTTDDFETAIEYVDDWCGAELTAWGKFRRWFGRTREAVRADPGVSTKVKAGLLVVSALLLFFVLSVAGLALWAIVGFLKGGLIEQDKTVAFWQIMASCGVAIVITWLFIPAQKVSNLLFGWWGDEPGQAWVSMGRKITYGGVILSLVFAMTTFAGASPVWRMVAAMAVLGMYASTFVLADNGWTAKIKLMGLASGRALSWVGLVGVVLILIGVAWNMMGSGTHDAVKILAVAADNGSRRRRKPSPQIHLLRPRVSARRSRSLPRSDFFC